MMGGGEKKLSCRHCSPQAPFAAKGRSSLSNRAAWTRATVRHQKSEWRGHARAGEADVLAAGTGREDVLARCGNVDGRAAAGDLRDHFVLVDSADGDRLRQPNRVVTRSRFGPPPPSVWAAAM